MRHAISLSSDLLEDAIDVDGVVEAFMEEAWGIREAGCEGCHWIGEI